MLIATINTAAGAGLADLYCAKLWQLRLQPFPDPARDIFAGGVFQAGYIVQVVMIQLLVDGLEAAFQVAKSITQPEGSGASPATESRTWKE